MSDVTQKQRLHRHKHEEKKKTPTLIAQPIQELRREIANNNRRARAQNSLRSLLSHSAQIEHARRRRSVDHGVLAGHLVGGDGHILPDLLGVADDVEVLAGGLDHDDVGALADVARDGAAGEAAAAGGQLVAAAVAEGGAGAGGVAEGPVQAAGELGGVGHEHDLVGDAGFDQLELDGADAAVVHVGGGDAVRAGQGVGDGDIADALHGELVVQAAVVSQDAAVAVGCVLAEADVGGDEEVGEAAAEQPDGLDHGALGVVCVAAESVLCVGEQRHAEKNDRLQALLDQRLQVGHDLVQSPAVLVGQAGDQRLLVGRV
jgi:hypothetical protein